MWPSKQKHWRLYHSLCTNISSFIPSRPACSMKKTLVGGLVAVFYWSISWVSKNPNWRTRMFQRGGSTTRAWFSYTFPLVCRGFASFAAQKRSDPTLPRASSWTLRTSTRHWTVDGLGGATMTCYRRKSMKKHLRNGLYVDFSININGNDCWFMFISLTISSSMYRSCIYHKPDSKPRNSSTNLAHGGQRLAMPCSDHVCGFFLFVISIATAEYLLVGLKWLIYKRSQSWKAPYEVYIWRFPEMGIPPNHPISWDFLL